MKLLDLHDFTSTSFTICKAPARRTCTFTDVYIRKNLLRGQYIADIVDDEKLKCFKSIVPSPKQPSVGSTRHLIPLSYCPGFDCRHIRPAIPAPVHRRRERRTARQLEASPVSFPSASHTRHSLYSNPPPILTPPLLPHCSSAVLAQHVTRPYTPPLPRLPPPAPLGTQPSAPPYALILRISDPYTVLMFPTRVLGSSTLARIHAGLQLWYEYSTRFDVSSTLAPRNTSFCSGPLSLYSPV
ncbi:hypothetical protein FB451DRAFT_1372555 [Mycena latifolia]|nr:hypothetical protein FB451DRAFT_1372555 [Mycena latifolia]